MDTIPEYKDLLEKIEDRLRSLSSERLEMASEFIAHLEEQEKRDRESRRERFLKAHESIMQRHEQFKGHKWPPHTDSVTLIRQMREGDEYAG